MFAEYWLSDLSSYLSVPVALYVIIRYRKIDPIFLPLVWYIIISGINELCSTITIYYFRNNAVNSNLYRLMEFILLMLAMKNLGAFKRKSMAFLLIMLIVSGGWCYENIVLRNITSFDGYFRIYESFVLSITAVHLLNIQLTSLRGRLLTNPVILLCLACILYFSVGTLTEIFYTYIHLQGVKLLSNAIFEISQWVNILYVSILAFIVYKMPSRMEFSLSF